MHGGEIVMRVKDSLGGLLGKTIRAVVVTKNATSKPRSQLFLILDGGESFEFWVDSEDIAMASKVDAEDLDEVIRLVSKRESNEVYVYDWKGRRGKL